MKKLSLIALLGLVAWAMSRGKKQPEGVGEYAGPAPLAVVGSDTSPSEG